LNVNWFLFLEDARENPCFQGGLQPFPTAFGARESNADQGAQPASQRPEISILEKSYFGQWLKKDQKL
jgi:hypothetical protein